MHLNIEFGILLTCVALSVMANNEANNEEVSDMLALQRIVNRYGDSQNDHSGDVCHRCPGVPGKKGAPGLRGLKGPRGPQGNPGSCVCDLSALRQLEEKLRDFQVRVEKTFPEMCYIGIKSGLIPISQLSAATTYNHPHHVMKNIKLNSLHAWCPAINDQNQWVQVDLETTRVITGIATQGRNEHPQWVTTYQVSYGNDPNNLMKYKENGATKTFSGNTDQQTIVRNRFSIPITARYIRVHPVGYYKFMCMRMELLDC